MPILLAPGARRHPATYASRACTVRWSRAWRRCRPLVQGVLLRAISCHVDDEPENYHHGDDHHKYDHASSLGNVKVSWQGEAHSRRLAERRHPPGRARSRRSARQACTSTTCAIPETSSPRRATRTRPAAPINSSRTPSALTSKASRARTTTMTDRPGLWSSRANGTKDQQRLLGDQGASSEN